MNFSSFLKKKNDFQECRKEPGDFMNNVLVHDFLRYNPEKQTSIHFSFQQLGNEIIYFLESASVANINDSQQTKLSSSQSFWL